MSEDFPMVYCKKEGKKVPIWYCLGSFMQQREQCPHLIEATVYRGKTADVVCGYKEVIT